MPHLDQRFAQHLHRLHQRGGTETAGLGSDLVEARRRQLHELGGHQRQEAVAQVPDEILGERARVATLLHAEGHGREHPGGISGLECRDELVDRRAVIDDSTGCGDQLERRQGVAGRSAALAHDGLHHRVIDRDAGLLGDPPHVLGELVGGQEVELQMLRAAADGVADLLRVGGREHEHDVRWRFLQRLQQRSLGRARQHVHLVEDVHLVPAGGAERRLLDEVAHCIDTVVARRVELVHVVARAGLHRQAGRAFAARLTVVRVLAVQHLGEDARRRGLARATRTGEEVCLALAVVGDGRLQRPHDMRLALQLAEPARAVAAIERLCGHRGEPTDGLSHGFTGEVPR